MNSQQQDGFSLVELMVALVVSLLLLAGILQILLGNRQSFSNQQASADIEDNQRLASFVIENVVAHAGYRDQLRSRNDTLFPPRGDGSSRGLSITKGAFISGASDSNGNDAIRIRFQAAGTVHDCLGTTIDGGDDTKPVPAVADMALFVDDENTLRCGLYVENNTPQSGLSLGTAETPFDKRGAQPLVDNVERFKVRYGLDTDGDLSADTYASSLNDTTTRQVISVRVQLVVTSDSQVLPSESTQSFTFADGSTLPAKGKTWPKDDRKARRMLDQTIALRNAVLQQP